MDSLMFSLPRIAPFFLLIVVGIFLRRLGKEWISFFEMANKFVFTVAMPVHMFMTLATADGDSSVLVSPVFLFVLFFTIGAFFVIWGLTEILYRKNKAIIGTLVQGAFRGNYILLGVPIMQAMVGDEGAQLAAFTMLAVIPAYNALSVVVLSVRSTRPEKPSPVKILRGIVTNPLIIAIVLALPFCFLSIPIPYVASQTLNYVGQCATPLGLLSVGAMFRLEDATANVRPALYATLLKVVVPFVAVATAYALGFQGIELLLMVVVFAAPTAVSTYPMALAMGGNGPLASNILIFSTCLSAFVMGGGISLLRMWGLL